MLLKITGKKYCKALFNNVFIIILARSGKC